MRIRRLFLASAALAILCGQALGQQGNWSEDPRAAGKILPVIKGQEFLEAARAQALAAGGKQAPFPVHQPLAEGLYVFYVFDEPKAAAYVMPQDLKRLQLTPAQVHTTAVENLRRFMQGKLRHKQQGAMYLLQLDGYYDASALLLDELWRSGKYPVKGELVAFPIARDMLLVTGSQEPDMEKAAGIALNAANDPSAIARAAYVRRNDRWQLLPR